MRALAPPSALAVAGLGLVACCAALAATPNLVEAAGLFLVVHAVAFACYAAGVRRVLRRPAAGPGLLAILLVALACRLVLLPVAPTLSTDAYRYVWDARVAAAGVSPYAHPPSAAELAFLRDDRIYPRLNHPTWRTIYPPGAQALFRTVHAAAPDSVLAVKVAVGAAELLALALLAVALRRLGAPPARLLIHAWNPLLLVETWGSAHLDGVVLPLVVGAALAAAVRRPLVVAALLGAGTLVKLYPAALLPALLGVAAASAGAWLRAGAVFVAVVAAGYLPFAGLGWDALGSLPRYVAEEDFNRGIVRSLLGGPPVAVAVIAAAAAIAGVVRLPLERRALWVAAAVAVLGPNVFPWYLVWVVPFLALAPSAVWIAFTGTVPFAYAFFLDEPWRIPGWARAVVWSPLLVWAAVAAWRGRRVVPAWIVPPGGRVKEVEQ